MTAYIENEYPGLLHIQKMVSWPMTAFIENEYPGLLHIQKWYPGL